MIQRRVGVVIGLAGLLIAANVAAPGKSCAGGLMAAACAQDSEDWDSEEGAADESDEGSADAGDESAVDASDAGSFDDGSSDVQGDAEGAGEQPAASNEDRVRAALYGNIREVIPGLEGHEFADGDSLKSMGANSVDRSEIIMMTLETLGLKMPLIELAKAENIGELISIINSKM